MSKNVIILAAGKGTRMHSDIPKVCHTILDKPMINYIVDAFDDFDKYVVVGYKQEVVESTIKKNVTFVVQEEQLGTGHAVKCVSELANKNGVTVVINGDLPFIKRETILDAIDTFHNTNSSLLLLTTNTNEPGKAGRVLLNSDNSIKKIVEYKDATDEERKVQNVNVGMYIFNNEQLFTHLEMVSNTNAQGEYYLTDLIELFINSGLTVKNYSIENIESLSCNDKLELANMQEKYRIEIIKKHLLNGVSIALNNVTIGPDVTLKKGVEIRDYTYITGSVIIKENSKIGPFARLRDNTEIGENCLIGNYVEIKNSKIEKNSKIAHHTYIGDAEIGENVNIGCGVITANYDGKNKHKTQIDADSFIGSNSTLVAPLNIGVGTFVAAGSVVTKSTPDNSFVIERAELKIVNKR